MMLLQAEWMRFIRNRVYIVSACVAMVLLLGSAVDGGSTARAYREYLQLRQQQWAERLNALRADASIVNAASQAPAVATATFEFGRTEAPLAPRPALGGLALSARHFAAIPADVGVTLESRYVDSRRTETIDNPLLAALGAPDFSMVVALLLPLLVIALTHGLVQEAREQGTWMLIRAQTPEPWRSLSWALLLRWLFATAVVAVPSWIALWLDPGATISAGLTWMLGIALCALLWTALAGVANLLNISSAASTLVLLSIWLASSFASPGLLGAYAEMGEKPHSQIAALHTIRGIQQDAERRAPELLEQWYREHPDRRPAAITAHTFPVTFVPRYLEQDRQIVPMMRAIEALRSRRADRIEPFMALAPGPGLVLLADRLAGSSAQQQNAYMHALAEVEQAWRRVLVPGVLSYRGLTEQDVDELAFIGIHSMRAPGVSVLLSSFAAGAAVLAMLFTAWRKRLLAPAGSPAGWAKQRLPPPSGVPSRVK